MVARVPQTEKPREIRVGPEASLRASIMWPATRSYAGIWGAPRRRVSPVEEGSTWTIVDWSGS